MTALLDPSLPARGVVVVLRRREREFARQLTVKIPSHLGRETTATVPLSVKIRKRRKRGKALYCRRPTQNAYPKLSKMMSCKRR